MDKIWKITKKLIYTSCENLKRLGPDRFACLRASALFALFVVSRLDSRSAKVGIELENNVGQKNLEPAHTTSKSEDVKRESVKREDVKLAETLDEPISTPAKRCSDDKHNQK